MLRRRFKWLIWINVKDFLRKFCKRIIRKLHAWQPADNKTNLSLLLAVRHRVNCVFWRKVVNRNDQIKPYLRIREDLLLPSRLFFWMLDWIKSIIFRTYAVSHQLLVFLLGLQLLITEAKNLFCHRMLWLVVFLALLLALLLLIIINNKHLHDVSLQRSRSKQDRHLVQLQVLRVLHNLWWLNHFIHVKLLNVLNYIFNLAKPLQNGSPKSAPSKAKTPENVSKKNTYVFSF